MAHTMASIGLVVVDIEGVLHPNKGSKHLPFELARLQRYVALAESRKVPPLTIATGRGVGYTECTAQDIGYHADTYPCSVHPPTIIENGGALYDPHTDAVVPHPSAAAFPAIREQILAACEPLLRSGACYHDPTKQFMVTLYPADPRHLPPAELYLRVIEALGDLANGVLDICHSSAAVDISPAGINKGVGLRFLAEHVGIPCDRILAIGDGMNDLLMLREAGWIACPGNSAPEVLAFVHAHRQGYVSHYHSTAAVCDTLEHQLGVRLATPNLLTYSEVQAIWERKSVFCAKVPARHVSREEGCLRIRIPDDPEVAVTRAGIRMVAGNSHGGHYRWPAGGLAVILATPDGREYLTTIYRDSGAPMWPDTLTVGTGVGADDTELLGFERMIYREGIEEVLIRTPAGLVSPVFAHAPSGLSAFAILEASRPIAAAHWPGDMLSLVECTAEAVELPAETTVEVEWRGERVTARGIVTIHEEESGIDLTKVVRYRIPFSLDEIAVADGEEGPGGKPLNRALHLLDVTELEGWLRGEGELRTTQTFVSGRAQGPTSLKGVRIIPFLRDIMKAIVSARGGRT